MRGLATALALVLFAAPTARAQDDALEGAAPAAEVAPGDYAAVLAFDICAAVVANGAARVGPTIAAAPRMRVTAPETVSELPGDLAASVGRMLNARPDTPVRTIAPPAEVIDEAPLIAVARMDAQSCAVLAPRGAIDALGPVFTRLADPDSGWTHMDERDGAHLYRRAGDLRMILVPRQSEEGADQVIVFREIPAPAP